jgi:hypothetical protein
MSEPAKTPWGEPRMRHDRDVYAAELRERFRAVSQRYFKSLQRRQHVAGSRDLLGYAAAGACIGFGGFMLIYLITSW